MGGVSASQQSVFGAKTELTLGGKRLPLPILRSVLRPLEGAKVHHV
jgi:hypothetical protein